MPPERESVRPLAAATSLVVYLQVLWRRRWLVLSIFALTLASAWLYMLLSTPIYRGIATILIDPESRLKAALAQMSGPGGHQHGQ